MTSQITYRPVKTSEKVKPELKEEKVVFLSTPDLTFEYYPQIQKKIPSEPFSSWITLAGVLFCNTIFGYHVLSFGIYYIEFTKAFDSTKALAGTIGALHNFFSAFTGLFASVVIKLYGCKICAVAGCLICSVGIFLSAFATQLYHLHITYSIIAGTGAAFINLPSLTMIQLSFNKHRAMATAIAVCGISLGNLIAPTALTLFIETFGWRGTLMIHSGIVLNALVGISLWQKPLNNTNADKEKKTVSNLLKNLFDFAVLRNKLFVGYIFATCMLRFNLSAYLNQTPSRMVYSGLDLRMASMILTFLFTCSLISRISISIALRFKDINPLAMATTLGYTQACMSIAVSMSTNYLWIAGCTLVFGIAQGGMIIQALLSTVKITGVENFARSRAVANMVVAFAALTPTPVTGWIFDVTQNYDLPFIISGLVGLTGSTCMLVICIIRRAQDNRERDKAKLELEISLKNKEQALMNGKGSTSADNLIRKERIRTYTC